MTDSVMSSDRIEHHVLVEAGTTSAFDAFTAYLGAWWLLAYHHDGGRREASRWQRLLLTGHQHVPPPH